jgi:hypothetical protein
MPIKILAGLLVNQHDVGETGPVCVGRNAQNRISDGIDCVFVDKIVRSSREFSGTSRSRSDSSEDDLGLGLERLVSGTFCNSIVVIEAKNSP